MVAFQGTATNPGPTYAHALGKTPELKIIKRRNNGSVGWIGTGTVVSQAIAGNLTSAKDYYFYLNSTAAVASSSNYWYGNDGANHFTVRHGNGEGGGSADPYLCLLFASVEGISKVGYYTGTDADINLSFGFTPRLFIVKMADGVGSWYIFDTVRGITGSGAPRLELNSDSAQNTSAHYVEPYTNGIKIVESGAALTDSGKNYVYYAHA